MESVCVAKNRNVQEGWRAYCSLVRVEKPCCRRHVDPMDLPETSKQLPLSLRSPWCHTIICCSQSYRVEAGKKLGCFVLHIIKNPCLFSPKRNGSSTTVPFCGLRQCDPVGSRPNTTTICLWRCVFLAVHGKIVAGQRTLVGQVVAG